MDEASCFHKLAIVKEVWDDRNPGNVSGEDVARAVLHTWCEHYHKPSVIRVDAEGALANSEEFLKFADSISARIEPIAGEAPWQMGRHSRHLRVLLNTVYDLFSEEDMSLSEAVVRGTMAKNERSMFRGFTPV